MSSKDTGGNAFPVPGDQPDESFNGMALRDYFAAKAMAAVIMNPETQHELAGMGRDEGMIVISRVAYMQADAMLAERAK